MRIELFSTIALVLAGCGEDAAKAPPRGAQGKPIEVTVITVKPEALTLTKELPGRTSAYRVAEVRSRVDGIILKRLFTEGADVKEGQPLFKIDPAPYQAALENAQAQLARAEANVEQAESVAERFTKLIESNAISRQEYDDARARVKAVKADVAAARASVKTARINLDFTTVKSPIAGRIGRAALTEGAFVQAFSASLLATVQQVDKIYVDMMWSSADALRLRRAIESGDLQTIGGEALVTIILEDGREYETPGTLQFTDVQVDETTGSISMRAVVPNPKGQLLPGMFVRARLDEGKQPNAILVPQRAVTRDQSGRAVAMVIGKDGKVERRLIVTDRAMRDSWLVTSGLTAGDRVIVEGLQKIRPGADVTPVAAQPPTKQASAPDVGSGSGSAAP